MVPVFATMAMFCLANGYTGAQHDLREWKSFAALRCVCAGDFVCPGLGGRVNSVTGAITITAVCQLMLHYAPSDSRCDLPTSPPTPPASCRTL